MTAALAVLLLVAGALGALAWFQARRIRVLEGVVRDAFARGDRLAEESIEHAAAFATRSGEIAARVEVFARECMSTVATLRKEGFTAGPDAPMPEPETWPAEIREFLDALDEPARTQTFAYVDRQRSVGASWETIQHELDDSVLAVPVEGGVPA